MLRGIVSKGIVSLLIFCVFATTAVGRPPGLVKHEQELEEELRPGAVDRRAKRVVRLGHRSNDEQTNDIWGYSDEAGREYAIVGTHSGTSIVDVTIPQVPEALFFIDGVHSTWRDMKTLGSYLYVVSDADSGGMQIVDLSGLPESAPLVETYTGFLDAHNIFIDEARSLAYVVGADVGSGGVRILDLSAPTAPVEVGVWDDHYVHDVYAVGTIVYAFATNAGVKVLDVTDPTSPTLESTVTYDRLRYTHSGYVTPDKQWLLVCDEFDEFNSASGLPIAKTRVMFFERVGSSFDYEERPTYTGPNKAIDHNVFVADGFAYLSNYTYGLAVIDVRDMNDPQFFGKFDTYFGNNSPKFAGAWGVYPYLPSGNILLSDINSGLYVLGLDQDEDGLAASREALFASDPWLEDSDGDGLLDGEEVEFGYDPTVFDEGVKLPGSSRPWLVAAMLAILYFFLDWLWSPAGTV